LGQSRDLCSPSAASFTSPEWSFGVIGHIVRDRSEVACLADRSFGTLGGPLEAPHCEMAAGLRGQAARATTLAREFTRPAVWCVAARETFSKLYLRPDTLF
jgi:hypothetical protein